MSASKTTSADNPADTNHTLPSIKLPTIAPSNYVNDPFDVILSSDGRVALYQENITHGWPIDIDANEIACIYCLDEIVVILKTDKTVQIWYIDEGEYETVEISRAPRVLLDNDAPLKFIYIACLPDTIIGIGEDNVIYSLKFTSWGSFGDLTYTMSTIESPLENNQTVKVSYVGVESEHTYVLLCEETGHAFVSAWDEIVNVKNHVLTIDDQPARLKSVRCRTHNIVGVGFDETIYQWNYNRLRRCYVFKKDDSQVVDFNNILYNNDGYIVMTEPDGTKSFRELNTGRKCSVWTDEGDVAFIHLKHKDTLVHNIGITTDGRVVKWKWGETGQYLSDRGEFINVGGSRMIKSAARK